MRQKWKEELHLWTPAHMRSRLQVAMVDKGPDIAKVAAALQNARLPGATSTIPLCVDIQKR